MAKEKTQPSESLFDAIRRERAQWDLLPYGGERFSVWEKDPDEYESGYYGEGWRVGRCRQVSKFFDTEEEAQEFIETHDPDKPGGTFSIRHEVGRYETHLKWRPA